MMQEGEYRGFKFKLRYAGYNIIGLHSFDPMAGNNLLYIPEEERNKKLKQKIRYEINKHLQKEEFKEMKGGIK